MEIYTNSSDSGIKKSLFVVLPNSVYENMVLYFSFALIVSIVLLYSYYTDNISGLIVSLKKFIFLILSSSHKVLFFYIKHSSN